jgi:hypothetical protein
MEGSVSCTISSNPLVVPEGHGTKSEQVFEGPRVTVTVDVEVAVDVLVKTVVVPVKDVTRGKMVVCTRSVLLHCEGLRCAYGVGFHSANGGCVCDCGHHDVGG